MSNRPNTRETRRHQPSTGSGGPPRWIWPVIGGLVALAAVVAVILTVGSTDAFEYGTVVVDGSPLPPLTDGAVDDAVGLPAPRVESTTSDGTTTIEAGRPTVVVFVAHWCPHCQREIPVVQQWLDDGNLPDDTDLVSVLTLSDQARGNWPPDAWLEDEGWTPPVVVDDEDDSVAQAYGLDGTPYWVAIAADGTVAARASGELGTDAIEGLVEAARAGGTSTVGTAAPAG